MTGTAISARPVSYTVLASHGRRTMAVRVIPTGKVTVYAPSGSSSRCIRRFVRSHNGWISSVKREYRRLLRRYPPIRFAPGRKVLYEGKYYTLVTARKATGCAPSFQARGNRLVLSMPSDMKGTEGFHRALVVALYRTVMDKTLRFVRKHAPSLRVNPAAVRISFARHRWGSCSHSGKLRISWRLATAPPSVLEYVVVHELCHLRQRGHSRSYWRILKSVLPGYEAPRRWLREHSLQLSGVCIHE